MYTSRTEGLHRQDKIWALFIDDARKFDETRMQRWKGDAEGILIFTGLFAATVANFLVDSGLPLLSSDSGGQTVDLLQDILAVLSNNTNNPTPALSSPVTAESAVLRSSIWINTLWSISLFISVFCALSATLIQQWIRDYTHDVYRRGHVGLRGPSYAILSLGVERFKMEHAVASIVTLIHISVALFFAGFLIMMYATNEAIASALASFVVLGILAYMLLSVMSVIWPDTPYRTPLTPLFYVIVQYIIYASTIVYRAWCRFALHWKLRWIEWYYRDSSGRLTHRMRTAYSYRADIVAPATPVQLNFWKTRLGYVDQHFSNWDDHLWAPRLFYTMKQIERIEETEEFWVAVAPHLINQYPQRLDFRTKSMELVLVKDLRIFRDMSRILERCLYGNLAGDPQREYLRIEPILTAFMLIRCVLRTTLRRNKIRAARPFREFPTPNSDMPPPIAPYDEYFERWPVLRDVFTALARELLRHPPPERPQAPPVDSEFMTARAQENSQDHSAYSTAPETPRQVREEAAGERGLDIDSSVYLTANSQSRGSPSDQERDLEAPGTDDGPAEPERMDIREPAPFPQLDPRKDPENWY